MSEYRQAQHMNVFARLKALFDQWDIQCWLFRRLQETPSSSLEQFPSSTPHKLQALPRDRSSSDPAKTFLSEAGCTLALLPLPLPSPSSPSASYQQTCQMTQFSNFGTLQKLIDTPGRGGIGHEVHEIGLSCCWRVFFGCPFHLLELIIVCSVTFIYKTPQVTTLDMRRFGVFRSSWLPADVSCI